MTKTADCSRVERLLRVRAGAGACRDRAHGLLCFWRQRERRIYCEQRAHRRAKKKLHKQIVATYDVEKQAAIKERLDAEYAAGGYDETALFVAQDPFGTDILSCYVRFATVDPVTVSYKVAGRKSPVTRPKSPPFPVGPHSGDTPATEHEFKVIGPIPNHKNTVTLTCTAQDGASRTSTFTVETPALKGRGGRTPRRHGGESNTPLADGLFTILGNDSSKLDFMYLSTTTTAVIRGEVPIVELPLPSPAVPRRRQHDHERLDYQDGPD